MKTAKALLVTTFFSFSVNLIAQEPSDSTVTLEQTFRRPSSFTGTAQTIDESQMNNKDQVTNAMDAIRGRVAGMTVERNGLNAMNAVRLRGTTSLTGANDPLIIVDGVMGGLTLLESVFPTDIESFTILKDASETSQFGSRGAAGVIYITTQKGSAGKLRVNYNSSFSFSNVYKRYNMMSADEYRNFAKSRDIKIVDLGNNTNFQKVIEQPGLGMQHHVAFQGGTEQSNYRVAIGYAKERLVVKNNSESSFHSNMNMTHKMFDGFLTIDLGMFANRQQMESLPDVQGLLYSAATLNPTFPEGKSPNGSYNGYSSASQIGHPAAILHKKNDGESSHISTHVKFTFNLSKELRFYFLSSYTYDHSEKSQYFPTFTWNKGQAYRGNNKEKLMMNDIVLNWDKKIDKHTINLLGLAETQKTIYDGYHVTVTNFQSDETGYDNLSAGALRPWDGTDSFFEDPRMVSYMVRANYSFDDKYILSGSARADGSSKFGSNNKWGFFPSVSASWILSKEAFMRHLTAIDDLKLNIGYGFSGNQNGIDSYTTLALLKPNGFIAAGSSNLVSFSELKNANPDLKWEVSKTFNMGFDTKMLKGRLIFSLNFYNTEVTDMLYPYNVSVPPFTYNTLVANLGAMQNRGLEISIGGTPFINKDMALNINANITFQRNKLKSLSGNYRGEQLGAPDFIPITTLNGAGLHGGTNYITYQIVGQSLGTFYLPHCSGLNTYADGTRYYAIENLNGGDLSLEDGEDRYIAGQAMPKVLLGSNISFRYKDFDISIQANGAFGHKVFNGTSLTYMNVSSFPLYNLLKEAADLNIKDQNATDYWLESGNYVNIDYITVGWRVPIRQNPFVKSLRLSLTMNNVATFTSYSGLTPMINSSNVNNTLGVDDKRSLPLYHTYTLGIGLAF